MPKVHGKVGERIAQEQASASQEVDDLYSEETPPESIQEPPADGEGVAPESTTSEAPPAPPEVTPAPVSGEQIPPPAAPIEPPPSEQASNKDQALKLEREHWRKQQTAWEAEKREIAEKLALQEQELAKIRQRDQQFEDMFKPEETAEEKEAKQFWGEVERRAEEKAKAFAQSAEQRAANLELQFAALQSQQAHPDFVETTGWTGHQDQLLDPEHPFTQYLANSPVVLDQIFRSPNKGEALYLAARNFRLNQPGAMDGEVENRVQARIAAETARIRAEEEAKYKAALSKLSNGGDRTPGSGSLMAMPAAGSTPSKEFDPDAFNPFDMNREKRTLFGQGFADIYAE